MDSDEERRKVGCGIGMIIIFAVAYLGMLLCEVYFLYQMVSGESSVIYTTYGIMGYFCAFVGVTAAILVFFTLCLPYSKYSSLKSILKVTSWIKAAIWLVVLGATSYIYFGLEDDVNSYYALCLVMDIAMYGMMVWPAMGCIYMDLKEREGNKVGDEETLEDNNGSNLKRGSTVPAPIAISSKTTTDTSQPIKYPKYNRGMSFVAGKKERKTITAPTHGLSVNPNLVYMGRPAINNIK